MRWLLDQGVPRSTIVHLKSAAHDAIHVGDIDMASATDHAILSYAAEDMRIMVTLDADFHAILARNRSEQPSVIRIREEGLKGYDVARWLLLIEARFSSELTSGCVMSCQNGKVRFRNLPLI